MASRLKAANAPVGCVTLVFTDVEGSTALWEAQPGAMREGIALHNRLMRESIRRRRGYEVKTEGDAFMVAFGSPGAAVAWCLEAQRQLMEAPWPRELLSQAEAAEVGAAGATVFRGLRVRMGAHMGEPDCVPDPTTGRMDYFGPVVNRAARLSGAAHGGQVLVSGAVRSLLGARVAGARLRELGVYHLKGLAQPETLHEVLPEQLSGRKFPPVRAQAPRKRTLPVPAGACLGRERELAALEALLGRGERLVTVLGPGGIGKTRLAVELGLRYSEPGRERGGEVVFCDLTRATSVSEIAELAAGALSACFGQLGTTQALVEAVGNELAGREGCLVILDNFEQVARHAVETVGRWRALAPQVQLLVTSREPLGLSGEATYRLEPLELDDAVTLFMQRAAAARSQLSLELRERPVVERITRSVDCIPLALELAAGRAGILSLEQVEEQLSRRFGLLASTRRDVEPRQATLRGAIDWSWNLLSERERAALAQLSVFRGCTLDAAEAVLEVGEAAGGGQTLDLVQGLVDRSMVQVTMGERGARYHLLVSIQAFAAQKLEESGGAGAARERHGRYYARLAAERFTGSFLDDDRIDSAAVEAERDNLTAALDAPTLPAEQKLELIVALCCQAYTRRPLDEMKALAARGESLASAVGSPALVTRMLEVIGVSEWLAGDHEAAARHLERALGQAKLAGDARLEALVLKDLASCDMMLSRGKQAAELLDRALERARVSGDPYVEARIIGNLGHVWYRQCDGARCVPLFERQLELTVDRPESLEHAFALNNLGGAKLLLNCFDEARRLHERALAILIRLGHFRFEAMVQCQLASVGVMRGEGALALEDVVRTLSRARRYGLKWAIAHALYVIGLVRIESGDARGALAVLQEGEGAAREAGDLNMLALTLAGRSAALGIAGEPDRARRDLEAARELIHEGHDSVIRVMEGFLHVGRALRAAAAGDTAGAREAQRAAGEIAAAARGWQDGTVTAPSEHPGCRFVGVGLPLLERTLERMERADLPR
ncbi:MAG: AAA family ATPase [Candidatus Wallbacteria bacterium]|nr:AAA family ATPase [Candidatus Wallbacteria bacterium]